MNNLTDLLLEKSLDSLNKVALRDSEREITYGELVHEAKKIASVLNKLSDGQELRIALFMKKDVESMILFWGVLFSSNIPVLLNYKDPVSINEKKIIAAKPHFLVVDNILSQHEFNSDVHLINLVELLNSQDSCETLYSDNQNRSEVCYMLTTSGTTGDPKVVSVSHKNVLNYTLGCFQFIGLPKDIVAAHVTSFSTDLGLTNTLMALATGGTLRIFNDDESRDPKRFSEIMRLENINFMKTTFSHLQAILFEDTKNGSFHLDFLVLGGEKLNWKFVKKLKNLNLVDRLFNHYGPSETTIGALMYEVNFEDLHNNDLESVPVGKPIRGVEACLMDPKDKTGELFIQGFTVTDGYFQNIEETKKQFVQDESGQIIGYKTGDLCKQLDDGSFLFLGRHDGQLKIKGHRVEIGEIEAAFLEHADIERVSVNALTVEDTVELEAYICPARNGILTKENLIQWLSVKISDYKIPKHLYITKDLYYNASGKVDFGRLRSEFATEKRELIESHGVWDTWDSSIEHCWKTILSTDEVKDTDNFYLNGGDSLSSIQLIGKLQAHSYDVRIGDVINNPTFGQLKKLNPDKINASFLKSDMHSYLLTSSQRRFLTTQHDSHEEYCQTMLFDIKSNVNIQALAQSIMNIMNNHPELTYKFRVNETPYCETKNWNTSNLEVSILDQNFSIAEQVLQLSQATLQKISITKGELFKARLMIENNENSYLFLASHHMCVDVISWKIIIDELIEEYHAKLTKNPSTFISENWRSTFYKNDIPLNKNEELIRPSAVAIAESYGIGEAIDILNKNEVKVVSFKMDETLSKAIKQMRTDNQDGPNIASLLLNCFLESLMNVLNYEKLTLDVEFHGRPQKINTDLSRSVSWWATTVPINFSKPDTLEDVTRILNDVSEYANEINGEGFNKILEEPQLISDIRFNYLGTFPDKYENQSISLIPSKINTCSTRSIGNNQEYKLYFTSRFINEDLIVDLQYQSSYFESRIEEIVNRFYLALTAEMCFTSKDHKKPVLFYGDVPTVGKPFLRIPEPASERKNKNVFLTGATGFLGSYLTKKFVESGSTVYCLIRGNGSEAAVARLKTKLDFYFPGFYCAHRGQIKVLNGDITQDKFRLFEEQYKILEHNVDTIVHCAADVNLSARYEELYESNVKGTIGILELAKTGEKELHYISTLAVSGKSENGLNNFSEADFDFNQSFISDYEKTKFDSEKLVRAHMKKGYTGKIYRVGHIAADSKSGAFQMNANDNRIRQIFNGILTLKKIPVSYSEKVSFSHVDIISEMVFAVASHQLKTTSSIFHIENPNYYSFMELMELYSGKKTEIKVVSDEEFKRSILSFNGSEEEKMKIFLYKSWVNRFTSEYRFIKYVSKNSIDLFNSIGINFPKTENSWLLKFLRNEGDKEYMNKSKSGQMLEKLDTYEKANSI